MFERPKLGEKCIIVHASFKNIDQTSPEVSNLEEFISLVNSTDAQIIHTVTTSLNQPSAKFFIGKGKIEEIELIIKTDKIELILFNHSLSPSQQRNIETLLNCRVLDRTGLILDIFAQRAQTFEGKLQVELAQLEYLSTRLIRGWTHLERQKGGIGLRGPGETQLELDKRMINLRLKNIKKSLNKVKSRRQLSRSSRKKSSTPTVSLVGYTNAGKSTLFNSLTQENIYAADQLFATLDPTLRKLTIPHFGDVVIADTVGFIQNLPHQLIDAFKATLEESEQADLILHVIDYSDENITMHINAVNNILDDLDTKNIPKLLIYNQIDKTNNNTPRVDLNNVGEPNRVWLSAKHKLGFDILFDAIAKLLRPNRVSGIINIPMKFSNIRAELYQRNCIIQELKSNDQVIELEIIIDNTNLEQVNKKYQIDLLAWMKMD